MKRWNEWTRKQDGWVERRRRLQKQFVEAIARVTTPRPPAVAPLTVPEMRPTVPVRGEE